MTEQQDEMSPYRPRTSLGLRLTELRDRAISKGMRLLSWEEIDEEVCCRRGERTENSQTGAAHQGTGD